MICFWEVTKLPGKALEIKAATTAIGAEAPRPQVLQLQRRSISGN